MSFVKTAAFYLAVVIIVVIAVFPFYYAIITSFKTGTELFQASSGRRASAFRTTRTSSARASFRAIS